MPTTRSGPAIPHADGAAAAPTRKAARRPGAPLGLPLGPGSLTWKLAGDSRQLILVMRTGVLQTMHPVISQALLEHSDYFEDPIGRLARSSGPILGVIYDEPAEGTGDWVRDRHRTIRSTDSGSKGYRALDPEVFYWAHATFFESMITTQRVFGTPLTEEQKHQLYGESVTWYSRYGMSMKPVPRDYEAFQTYWEMMIAQVLEATPVAVQAMHRRSIPRPGAGPAWLVGGPVAAHGSTWLLRASLPPVLRERLGGTWSLADRMVLSGLATGIRTSWPVVPTRAARLAPARAAELRTASKD